MSDDERDALMRNFDERLKNVEQSTEKMNELYTALMEPPAIGGKPVIERIGFALGVVDRGRFLTKAIAWMGLVGAVIFMNLDDLLRRTFGGDND